MNCVFCDQPSTRIMYNQSMQAAGKALPLCAKCSGIAHLVAQIAISGENVYLGIGSNDPEPVTHEDETLAVLEAMEIFKAQWSALEAMTGKEMEALPPPAIPPTPTEELNGPPPTLLF